MQNIIEQTDTSTTLRWKKHIIQNTNPKLEIVGHNVFDEQSLPVATICVPMMKFRRLSAGVILKNHTWQDPRRERDLPEKTFKTS